MPKIRLSALATDIKGKSGGSVFSTNAGGTYFRNNPSGTGSKKPATSVRKQLFASLSQSWRNLTNSQQVAWSDAGVLYPTTNAWGETRIPKGFELFMRLNGNLQAAGETLLLVPIAPRAIPALNSLDADAPDLFQLIGQRGFTTNNTALSGIFSYGKVEDFRNNSKTQQTQYFSTRFSLNQFSQNAVSSPPIIEIFSITGNLSNLIAEFVQNEDKSYFLRTTYYDFTGYRVTQTSRTISLVQMSSLHLGIQFFEDLDVRTVIYLNGQLENLTRSESGTPAAQMDNTAYLALGKCLGGNSIVIFQDFRVYNGSISNRNARLISYGYILGTEQSLWPLSSAVDFVFENYCFRGLPMEITFTGDIQPPMQAYFNEFTAVSVPDIAITLDAITESNFKIQVLCSDFISPGKNAISAVTKTVGYFDALDVSELEIREELENLLKFTIGNTVVFLQVRLLDILSGAVGVLTDVQPAKGKGPRFKAGAELSGKVN